MHIYWQVAIHSYINQNIILNLICIYIRIRIYTLNMYTKANYCTSHIAGFVARNLSIVCTNCGWLFNKTCGFCKENSLYFCQK